VVSDDDRMPAWREQRKEQSRIEGEGSDRIEIDEKAWWYRLKFVGKYGPTLFKKGANRQWADEDDDD